MGWVPFDLLELVFSKGDNGRVAFNDCKIEFIKHVFPRLAIPGNEGEDG